MRAFVALEIPDRGTLDNISALQGEISAAGADLKLVERENLHFTVKFLGEISDVEAKDAAAKLRALDLNGADVTVKGVDAFPSPSRPTVIWVGLARGDEEKVNPIAAAAVHALEGIGEHDTRPFVAHITVARVRSGRNVGILASLLRASSERVFGSFRLAALKLVSSNLTPRGPIYTDLEVYPLK
ncbi:MAG: RNA 2',3'-cyclic phosphodiesterase [Nitrososphaerota archaeon]|nr:RNA 2',3'-cyclic phosphodiesterase [Nitrososphaerota archaeon]